MNIFKSKTIWLGLAAVFTGVATYVSSGEINDLLISAFGLLQIIIRFYTDKPLSEK